MTTNINNQPPNQNSAFYSNREFTIIMVAAIVLLSFAIFAVIMIVLGLSKESNNINSCNEKASHSEICPS